MPALATLERAAAFFAATRYEQHFIQIIPAFTLSVAHNPATVQISDLRALKYATPLLDD